MKTYICLLAMLCLTCAPTKIQGGWRPVIAESEPVEKSVQLDDSGYAKFVFNTDVDAESTDNAIKFIEGAEKAGAKVIFMEISTNGGSVGAGFELSKAMENAKVPVVCIVDDKAVSMGMYLLQSCDYRSMTKRSYLMTHQPAITTEWGGHENEWRGVADLLSVLNAAMIEHIIARTNVSADEIKAKISGGAEWWMGWQEASDRKFVDAVVDSSKGLISDWEKGKIKFAKH